MPNTDCTGFEPELHLSFFLASRLRAEWPFLIHLSLYMKSRGLDADTVALVETTNNMYFVGGRNFVPFGTGFIPSIIFSEIRADALLFWRNRESTNSRRKYNVILTGNLKMNLQINRVPLTVAILIGILPTTALASSLLKRQMHFSDTSKAVARSRDSLPTTDGLRWKHR